MGAEAYDDGVEAIAAEKRIKRWKRRWTIDLLETSNPAWNDISAEIH